MKLASAHLYLTSSSCVWPLPLQMITPSEINAAFRRITPLQNSAVNAAPTPPSISTSPPHTHTQHWTNLHTTKLHLGGKNCKPFSKRWLFFLFHIGSVHTASTLFVITPWSSKSIAFVCFSNSAASSKPAARKLGQWLFTYYEFGSLFIKGQNK